MGGALDSSRFKYFLSQALGCNANEVEGMVIGGHGDTTMIPLARLATYKGIPVSKLLSAEKLQEVVASTMVGGATLTKLLGTSAWYAPGAAGAFVVESIIHNQARWFLALFTWKVSTENLIFASVFLLSLARTVSRKDR